MFVALFSFLFGNLLLENQAAYLTFNILAAVSNLATLCAGSAFVDYCADDLRYELACVISFVLPIAAFVIGQAVQFTRYDAGEGVYILTTLFGEIPVYFLVLSAINCALCTAMVCANCYLLGGERMTVRTWIFVLICSVCFAVIPMFAGAVGLVVLPIVGFALNRRYFKEDETFLGFGIATLVWYYLLGQFIQYYFYVVGDSTLAIATLLSRVPLWLQIMSTIVGAGSVGLTIYCYVESDGEAGSSTYVMMPGLMLGALPAVTGIPLAIVMSILTGQAANYAEEKYKPIAPLIAAFGIGQTLLWWNFADTENIPSLFNLLLAFGVESPADVPWVGVFAVISSLFGVAACVLSIILAYRFLSREQTSRALWVIVPFVALTILIPTLSSIPLFIVALTVLVASNRAQRGYPRADKRVKRRLSAGMLVVIGLQLLLLGLSFCDFTLIGKYMSHGIYFEEINDKYYVTGYLGNPEMLVVPKTVNGREVVGVTGSFAAKHENTAYTLHYDHADGNDDAGMVIVLKFDTAKKFPVPKREGYTFYGWWSSPSRQSGNVVADGSGKLLSTYRESRNVYAMWYDSDYKFITSINEITNNLSGKYVLMSDITIEGNYTPISGLSGMETDYRRPFSGVLDGNYHTVTYSITGSRRYNGLFSWIGSKGTVKNLGVNANIDVDFNSYSTQYYAFAGGIAAINDGVIENCWSTGSIKLRNKISVAFAAGIAGASGTENARTGAITRCFNLADIESVADDSYAAGILGSAENDGQTVSYCYNRGSLKATGVNSNNTAAGGIISHGRTHSKNSFNAGAILTDYADKQTLGGILGFIRNTPSHNCPPENCAWLKAKDCEATWGVGTYPNDETGGNNNGVTVVKQEDQSLVKLLNAGSKYFVLTDGKLHLAWERYL